MLCTIHHQLGSVVNRCGAIDRDASIVARMMITHKVNGQGADLLAQLHHGHIVDILIDFTSVEKPSKADGKVTRCNQTLYARRLPEVRGILTKVEGGNFSRHFRSDRDQGKLKQKQKSYSTCMTMNLCINH